MRTKIQLVEARFGKPMAAILKELYSQGLSQRDIAERMGVSQSTISQWTKDCGLKLEVKTVIVSDAERVWA